MGDERRPEILGALPRTRPERRSTKRPARDGAPTESRAAKRSTAPRGGGKAGSGSQKTAAARPQGKSQPLRQPPQPRGIPSQPRSPVPSHPSRPEILGTAVRAAGELAEIGLAIGTRALRRAAARLPRP